MVPSSKKKAKIVKSDIIKDDLNSIVNNNEIFSNEWEALNLHPLTLKAIQASG